LSVHPEGVRAPRRPRLLQRARRRSCATGGDCTRERAARSRRSCQAESRGLRAHLCTLNRPGQQDKAGSRCMAGHGSSSQKRKQRNSAGPRHRSGDRACTRRHRQPDDRRSLRSRDRVAARVVRRLALAKAHELQFKLSDCLPAPSEFVFTFSFHSTLATLECFVYSPTRPRATTSC
jgi:hypothetical protein